MSVFILASLHSTTVANLFVQKKSDNGVVSCSSDFTSLGTCNLATLDYLNTYIFFKFDMNPYALVKKAVLSFVYGDNVNTGNISFAVKITAVNPWLECTQFSPKNDRYSNTIKFTLQGLGDETTDALDVTRLVQNELNRPDWRRFFQLTFVISQTDPRCEISEDIVIAGGASFALNVFYEDLASKFPNLPRE